MLNPTQYPEQREYLARTHIASTFTGLAEPSQRALAGFAQLRSFTKGEEIQREGERGDGIFLVASGRVKRIRHLASGRSLVLSLFHPGDLFGAVSTLGGHVCDASMVALVPTTCLAFGREALFDFLEKNPKLVSTILPALTRRLVECNNCLVEMTCSRVEKRFAQLFLKFTNSVGRPQPEGTFIPIPLSRQELADMTGTTIETCIRLMSRWAKHQTVKTHKDGFTVLDRRALEELAAEGC